MMPVSDLREICRAFGMTGTPREAVPWGSGHVNRTWRVDFVGEGRPGAWILQRLNENIFRDPVALVENAGRVTAHLAARSAARGLDPERRCLRFLPAADGRPWHRDRQGGFWRASPFIGGTRAWDVAPDSGVAREAAAAFGRFLGDLSDLPGPPLVETIPGFHDTPARLRALEAAAGRDRFSRAAGAAPEISLLAERREDFSRLARMAENRVLPRRTVHNDTKISNLLFDEKSGEALCVTDLDTVGPGFAAYDFGDLVRTVTSPEGEDSVALEKVEMRLEMFEALLEGYLRGAGGILRREEIALLPFAGLLVTLEQAARFLADYLEGDAYYPVSRPGHNLERARNQLKLLLSIEERMPEMERLAEKIA